MAKWTIEVPDELAAMWEGVVYRQARPGDHYTENGQIWHWKDGVSNRQYLIVRPRVRTWECLGGSGYCRSDDTRLTELRAVDVCAILNAGQKVIDEGAKP